MIQDIFPHILDNHYRPDAVPAPDSPIIAFRPSASGEKEIMVRTDVNDGSISFPRFSEFEEALKDKAVFIFGIDSEEFFLLQDIKAPVNGYSFVKFRDMRKEALSPKSYVFAAYTAFQLDEWYETTAFCGKCGSRNENDKSERARTCPVCGNKIYPRINPAVIVGVTDKDTNRLIITKYRRGFALSALVAGFTEIGETLEETVSREVMEEVGLKVRNIRYYKSQPWGIASDILAGFFCDVDGDKEITMDDNELKYACWNAPDEIELQPLDYSLTNEMMKLFKEKGYEGTL